MTPVQRNFRLGLLHESLWGAAQGFISPLTILPLAAHDLGRGVADAGLLEAALFAGMNSIQLGAALLLPASWTDPKKTAWLHAPAVALTLATAVSLALPLDAPTHWTLLLCLVTGHWICLGLVVPHWATLSSRNIPEGALGRYFGWCFSASGLAMAATGVLAGWLASVGGVAWGYAACFAIAAAVQGLSAWVLGLTRPLRPCPDPPPPIGAFLKARWRDFRASRIWLGFGAIVVLLQTANASTLLFTSFLKDRGLGTSDFELLNPAIALGAMLGSVGLGRLMDRRGPRLALGLGTLPLLCALAALAFGHSLGADTLAYLCAGAFTTVFGAVMLPWLLGLAYPGQQPAFTGLYGTLTAPWNFLAPWLLGRLAARAGYGPAFLISAAGALGILVVLALPLGHRVPKEG